MIGLRLATRLGSRGFLWRMCGGVGDWRRSYTIGTGDGRSFFSVGMR